MPLFRVHIIGRGIVLMVDGKRELHGFTDTRLVEAADADHAGEYALELVQEHPALKEPLNGPDDPCPMVLIDFVEEVVG
jgi:hypothetical protein